MTAPVAEVATAASTADELIRQLVDTAPPLNAAQRARIAAILRPCQIRIPRQR